MSGHAWNEYRGGARSRCTRAGALVAIAITSAVGGAAARADVKVTPVAPDATPVQAVWVDQDIRFTYFGITSYYSCEGLRSKLKYILGQLGLRPDMKVSVSCANQTGIDILPHVRIRGSMAAPATPEVIARLNAEAPKRELLARAQGNGQSTDPATAQFPATYRRVVFDGSPLSSERIGNGDCELFEHLRDHVFPKLGVRMTPESRLACVPHAVPLGSVHVVVESLAHVPEPRKVADTGAKG